MAFSLDATTGDRRGDGGTRVAFRGRPLALVPCSLLPLAVAAWLVAAPAAAAPELTPMAQASTPASTLPVSPVTLVPIASGTTGALTNPAGAVAAPEPGPAPITFAPWLPGAPSSRSGAAVAPQPPPTDLKDVSAWLDYKQRARIAALPMEARIFYRRGLVAWGADQHSDAIRLVRGAAELDPSFAAPHWTLASWFLTREPSQALVRYATVVELLRQDFLLQAQVVANAFFLLFHTFFFGVLATALLLIAARQAELRHMWQDRLWRYSGRITARLWSGALLVLPFVAGFGLALPAIVLLGILWPVCRVRERFLFLLLVVVVALAPAVGTIMGDLALPLRDDQPPFYGVTSLQAPTAPAKEQARLADLARLHADNALVQFGLGWTARRAGDLATAEQAYRHALERWGEDDRTLNDLGVAVAMQGRLDEALGLFGRATEHNPGNAAAWFNAAELHTRRFEYQPASDALARASAINFDLVKTYQSQPAGDGALPLAEQWVAPAAFWRVLLDPQVRADAAPVLPASWRARLEASGWPMSAVAILLAVLGVLLGVFWHRALPLRACANCGRVVCRRCAQRQRELALCRDCARVAARAESPDFARILLAQHRRKSERRTGALRTALATAIPGYGLLSLRRVFGPLVLVIASVALISRALGLGGPFVYQTRIGIPSLDAVEWLALGPWIAIYLFSVAGYFSRRGRETVAEPTPPVRSRARQARITAEAA